MQLRNSKKYHRLRDNCVTHVLNVKPFGIFYVVLSLFLFTDFQSFKTRLMINIRMFLYQGFFKQQTYISWSTIVFVRLYGQWPRYSVNDSEAYGKLISCFGISKRAFSAPLDCEHCFTRWGFLRRNAFVFVSLILSYVVVTAKESSEHVLNLLQM